MAITSFGEWRPDISDYQSTTTRDVQNVIPRGDGYGPFPSLAALSASLGSPCRGAFTAYRSDGSIAIFAATDTDIFLLNNTDLTWTKVSKGGGPYSAVSSGELWCFKQFNNLVIVVQANIVAQVYDIVVSTEFDDLDGNPPQARYIDIVGRFAVLSGLLSAANRIQWSGLNDINGPDSWTPGLNSSDFQDLPDGGACRGVAGGEYGVILQDNAIRRMTYVPGSPVIFQIDRIAQDKGVFGPYSVIRHGETVLFYSTQGFQRVDPGGVPTPIGRERVDRAFFADLDKSSLQLFVGAADPRSSLAFWAYKSVNGTEGQFDMILCYDKNLDRFTPLKVAGEYLLPLAQPGLTLEALGLLYPNLDSMTQSLDSFASAATPEIAVFSPSNVLSFFRGPNLEARLETAEQGTDGRRIKFKGFRPITDAPSVFGTASMRETPQAVPVFTDESAINPETGRCDFVISTRYSRAQVRIPEGTDWSFIAGIEPDIVLEGKR